MTGITFEGIVPTLSSQNDLQFSCNNTAQTQQEVRCLFPVTEISYRNISSVTDISFPYSQLNLNNYSTNIKFPLDISTDVSGTVFNRNASTAFSLNAMAEWLLEGNNLLSKFFTSQVDVDIYGMNITMPETSCLQFVVRDSIYSMNIAYNALFNMQIYNQDKIFSGSDLLTLANSVFPNISILDANTVQFNATGNIIANAIITEVIQVKILNCDRLNIIPSTLPPIVFAVERSGISNGTLTQFGLTSNQSNLVFNYDDIDKYSTLSTGGECFKFFFLIYIPIPFIPFILLIPVWPDVSTLEGIVDFFTTTLSNALKGVEDLENVANSIEDQITPSNAVALALRAVAVTKAILTGKANKQLFLASKRLIEARIAQAQAAANLAKALSTGNINDINSINVFVQKLATFASSAKVFVESVGKFVEVLVTGNVSQNDFIRVANATNSTAVAAIDLYEVIPGDLPGIDAEAEKTRIGTIKTSTVNLVSTILQLVPSIANGQNIGETLITTAENAFSAATDLYSAIYGSPNVKQADLIISEEANLEAAGAAEQKTIYETEAENAAKESADAIEQANAAVNNLLRIKKAKEFALNNLNKGLNKLSDALLALDAAARDSIEGAKRNKVGNLINQHLNRDLYKISRLGNFDPRTKEAQIVINDLNGVKIFSYTGELLFYRKDFCNQPFTLAPSNNADGCNSGSDHCGGSSYSCAGYDYWHNGLHYWVGFSFYDNHNLDLGGIRVGDFDGDGVDDLWCFYPAVTKNYDAAKANEIIFAPLKSNYTSEDTCSYLTTLQIPGWCQSGTVKIGDFNGDNQSDALCITFDTQTSLFNFNLLYGFGGTFSSASENIDGKLSQTKNWSKDSKIVIGDFDGDKYSDMLAFNSDGFDLLYGSANLFVTKSSFTSNLLASNQPSAVSCYNTEINHILVGDLNDDKRDDIVCITGSQTIIIDSSTALINKRAFKYQSFNVSSLEISSSLKTTLIVENINLQPITNKNIISRKFDTKIQENKNFIHGNQVLLADLKSELGTKSVNEVVFPHSYLALDSFNVETKFTLYTKIVIPGTLFGEDNNVNRFVNIDVSAYWLNQNLVLLSSSQLQSFSYSLKVNSGSCLNSKLVTEYIEVKVPYDASARMYIEENQIVKYGQDLISSAQVILPNVALGESSDFVTFTVSGHLILNILGIGYENLDHC
jgi:hypothetical protein